MNTLRINTDGGARGNPGPAAVGVVLRMGDFERTHNRVLGTATNNVAEYTAVIDALELVPQAITEQGVERLEFYLDSQLVVRQILGQYKIKEPTLLKLCMSIRQRLAELALPYSFNHVPRAENSQADKLVNQALDGR